MLCAYTLLKVVNHYDVPILSMSMVCFQNSLDGWVGGVG